MKQHKIQRVLIANRGEIAIRIIRACRQLGMTAIAVYSDVDASALHVQLADEAYPIGPAQPSESYLNIPKLIEVAKRVKADAIHPGYGFLSEREVFAKAVEDAGLIFVGPSSKVIAQMGSKITARMLAEKLKLSVLPGTDTPLTDSTAAEHLAKKIGYPILLKASAGGGGKGMRIVRDAKEFQSAFEMAQSEAQNAFGDPSLLIEKYLENPHHVEVQILGDSHGNVVHLFERECSLQRRHQKVIEEAPSPTISAKTRKALCDAAVKLGKSVGYVSAGTVECLVDHKGHWYFLEMNTRIQVEHPVTEMTTGIDLVAWQLRIANGEKIPWKQSEITCIGAAMECRIYAEDPFANFLPSPGKIQAYQEPSGPGVRVDSGVAVSSHVPMNYDPILAKLITWGDSRGETLGRMQQALQEYVIAGIRTSIPFHLLMMTQPEFVAGKIHTQWLSQHLQRVLDTHATPPLEILAIAVLHKHLQCQPSSTPVVEASAWETTARLEGLRT
jgi:acetyl-CoA carboxylase biotin carboxylase subunit